MSDDRLFASNQAIGRKWYYVNIILLSVLVVGTQYLMTEIIFPLLTTDFYVIFGKGILYFLYLFYAITFFALIERRLYDISGSRNNRTYKILFQILQCTVIYQIAVLILPHLKIEIPIDINQLQQIATILDIIFMAIAVFIGLIRGKITCLSYKEYKNKIKYED